MNNIEKLENILKEINTGVIMLSGGADSSFLAYFARKILGDNFCAVTISSPLLPEKERKDAKILAAHMGMTHEFIHINELEDANFVANPKDKCYICKKMRLMKISEWADKNDIPWILDGSNADDIHDFRPGMKALREFKKARSPLLEAGIGKSEIRAMSKAAELFTWDKPAAACLAARISLDQSISRENLRQVEKAEDFIGALLPHAAQLRVRHHSDIARIEVDFELIPKIFAESSNINSALKEIGFKHVSVDISGYKMGSLN